MSDLEWCSEWSSEMDEMKGGKRVPEFVENCTERDSF